MPASVKLATKAAALRTPKRCWARPFEPFHGATPPLLIIWRTSSTSMTAHGSVHSARARAVVVLPTAGPPVRRSGRSAVTDRGYGEEWRSGLVERRACSHTVAKSGRSALSCHKEAPGHRNAGVTLAPSRRRNGLPAADSDDGYLIVPGSLPSAWSMRRSWRAIGIAVRVHRCSAATCSCRHRRRHAVEAAPLGGGQKSRLPVVDSGTRIDVDLESGWEDC